VKFLVFLLVLSLVLLPLPILGRLDGVGEVLATDVGFGTYTTTIFGDLSQSPYINLASSYLISFHTWGGVEAGTEVDIPYNFYGVNIQTFSITFELAGFSWSSSQYNDSGLVTQDFWIGPAAYHVQFYGIHGGGGIGILSQGWISSPSTILNFFSNNRQGTLAIKFYGEEAHGNMRFPYNCLWRVGICINGTYYSCVPEFMNWHILEWLPTGTSTWLSYENFKGDDQVKVGDVQGIHAEIVASQAPYMHVYYNPQGSSRLEKKAVVNYDSYVPQGVGGVYTFEWDQNRINDIFQLNGWYLCVPRDLNQRVRGEYVYIGIYIPGREGYNPDIWTPIGNPPQEEPENWLDSIIDFFKNFWKNVTDFFSNLFGPPDSAHMAYFTQMKNDISQRFPFCVVAWAAGVIGELSVLSETATAPRWTFSIMGGDFTLDLSAYNDWFFWARTLIRGMIWFFFAIWIIRVLVFEGIWHIRAP